MTNSALSCREGRSRPDRRAPPSSYDEVTCHAASNNALGLADLLAVPAAHWPVRIATASSVPKSRRALMPSLEIPSQQGAGRCAHQDEDEHGLCVDRRASKRGRVRAWSSSRRCPEGGTGRVGPRPDAHGASKRRRG
eukprot:scaffold5066_cov403-Prasinococcus_capsulatus_cf.AAC.8